MPAHLTFDEYGEALGAAATVMRAQVGTADPAAPVPTCPGWSLRDLVVHQGVVYAWAGSLIRGEDMAAANAAAGEAERDGQSALDLPGWFDDRAVDILNILSACPPDGPAFFFLRDAPDKRLAWCRRQAHETAIHAVDAMAAKWGGVPPLDRLWLRPRVAADGIDELLCGFLPRRSSAVRADEPLTVRVTCTDAPASWLLRLSPEVPEVEALAVGAPAVEVRATAAPELATEAEADDGSAAAPPPALDADVEVTGPAVALYLALWNRGELAQVAGARAEEFIALWRERSRIEFA